MKLKTVFFASLLLFNFTSGFLPKWTTNYADSSWSISENLGTHYVNGNIWESITTNIECLPSAKYLDFTTSISHIQTHGSKGLVVGIMHKLCADNLKGESDEFPGGHYCNQHNGFGYNSGNGKKISFVKGEQIFANSWFGTSVEYTIRTFVNFEAGTIVWYRSGVVQGVAFDNINFQTDFREGIVAAFASASDVAVTIELLNYNCQLYPVKWISYNNVFLVGGNFMTMPPGGSTMKTGWLSQPCIYPPAKKLDFTIKVTEHIRFGPDYNALVGIMDTQCINNIDNIGSEYLGHNDLCPNSWGYHAPTGHIYHHSSHTQYASTWNGEGYIIRTIVDFKLQQLGFYLNGDFQGWAVRNLDFRSDIDATPAKYPKGITGAYSQHGPERGTIELIEYVCE